MAVPSDAVSFLSSDEVNSVSGEVLEKIDRHLNIQKAEYEKLRVDAEQQCLDLERQLVENRRNLENKSEQLTSIQGTLKELESKFSEVQKEHAQSQDSVLKEKQDNKVLTSERDSLLREKNELLEVITKQNAEKEQLNQKWKTMSDQLVAANNAKCEALVKVEELASREVSLEYREKRLEQEKELISRQIETLTVELDNKNTELMNVRREESNKFLSLQTELGEKLEENRIMKEQIIRLEENLKKQTNQSEDLAERLRSAREDLGKIENNYRQELTSQKRLSELYKEGSEDANSKSEELTSAVEELQRLLKETSDNYDELDAKCASMESSYKETIERKNEAIASLKKELEVSNDLLAKTKKQVLTDEGIEALSPAAAAASKVLRSGMTLTQIYSQYVTVSEELFEEKKETTRLSQYLDHILQEIEERAPFITRQREEYEKSLITINNLTDQLQDNMLEFESQRNEADEAKRKLNHQIRDCERLRSQNEDLSKQVQALLKEVVNARAGLPTQREPKEAQSTPTTSSEVIDQNLVVFHNIEELQEQNQRLLAVVRELSEKKDNAEKEAVAEKTAQLEEELELVKDELSNIKSERQRQEQLVESVVRQRDMYRVLLQNTGMLPLSAGRGPITSTPAAAPPQGSPSPVKPSPVKSPLKEKLVVESSDPSTKEALDQLNQTFKEYRQEKAENDRILQEQLDKSRQDIIELKTQNSKLSSQLEYNNERFKISQANTESYRRQINALEEKNKSYSTMVAKHEQSISILKQELLSNQQKLAQAEVKVRSLKEERSLLKDSENRLLAEKEVLQKQLHSHVLVTTNLESIKNNLERGESQRVMQLQNQLQASERELTSTRRRLDKVNDDYHKAMKAWESEMKTSRTKLETETGTNKKVKEELESIKVSLNTVRQEKTELEEQLKKAEAKSSSPFKTVLTSKSVTSSPLESKVSEAIVKDLKVQLQQSQTEVKSLKEQINIKKQHAEQYKNQADSLEKALREENEASKVYKLDTEKKLHDTLEAKATLEQQVTTLESEKQDLMNEHKRVTSETYDAHADLRKELTKLQMDHQQSLEELKDAKKNEEAARQECLEQARIAKESQDKYEQELMLHAADVQALTAVKEELGTHSEKQTALEDACRKAEEELKGSKASWEVQEKMLRNEIEQLTQQNNATKSQNTLLHEQLQRLSTQMASLQSKDAGNTSLSSSFTEEDAKSSEQLLEIIKYLRRDKEISSTRSEAAQAEATRLSAQLKQIQKQLDETQTNLREEREKSEVSVVTASKHADLLRRIETLNALTDSNKLLREERDALQTRLKEMEAKSTKYEEDIAPLQEKNREMSSRCETLSSENQALKNDLTRWRQRTNMLIERSNKTNPEDYKKLQQEKENLQKQLLQQTEESRKHQAEIGRLTRQSNFTKQQHQEEVKQLSQTVSKEQEEKRSVQATLDRTIAENAQITENLGAKEAQLSEVQKNVVQVKKIGRKYKAQYEELKAQFDELNDTKQKLDAEVQKLQQQATVQPAAADPAALQEAQQQSREAGRLEGVEQGKKEAETQIQMLNEELEKVKKEITEETKKENEKLKKEIENLKNVGSERDKKTRSLIENARLRIAALQKENGDLTKERDELKQQVEKFRQPETTTEESMRFSALKSQFESQQEHMQKQRLELENLQKEMESLQQKLSNTEKELETNRQLVRSQQTAVKATPAAISSEKSGETPTANIRPMSGSPSISQSKLPQGTQAISVAPSRSTPTASIRPMAKQQQQRTATVMPTSLATPTVALSTSQVQAQVSPTPQISSSVTASSSQTSTTSVVYVAVPPTPAGLPPGITVRAITPDDHAATEETPVRDSYSIFPVSQTSHSQQHEDPHPEASQVTPEQQSTPSIAVVTPSQPQPHSSSETHPTVKGAATILKRPRESDTDAPTETDSQTKRTRTSSGAFEVSTSSVEEVSPVQMQAPQQFIRSDDVIVIDSDDEDQEGESNEEYEEFEEEAEEEEYAGEEDGDDGIEDDDIDENGDEDNDPIQGEVPEETPSTASDIHLSQSHTDGQVPSQSSQRTAVRVPCMPRQQLAPVASLPQFEEGGDDGIVPSTPTLAVPRRADGFAEAVSSPMGQQPRFVFGSTSDQSTSQTGLSHDSMMDNTQVDLSQLEDGGGRSVPTTPVQRSPPGDGDQQMAPIIVNVRGASSAEASAGSTDETSQEAFEEESSQEEGVTEGEALSIPVQTTQQPHWAPQPLRGRGHMRREASANRHIPIVWNEPSSQGQGQGYNFPRNTGGQPQMRGQLARRSFRHQTARRGRRGYRQ